MCANCPSMESLIGTDEISLTSLTGIDPNTLATDALARIDETALDNEQLFKVAMIASQICAHNTLMNLCLRSGDIDFAMKHAAMLVALAVACQSFPEKS